MRRQDRWSAHAAALVGAVSLPILFYIARGALGGFVAADDFVFLTSARDLPWSDVLSIGEGGHFYRPVVRVWFIGAVGVCGEQYACFHLLQLGLHAANGTALFVLTYYLGRDRLLASLATLVFMCSPGYVEAVMWLSCATEVLSALFVTVTVLLSIRAADASSRTLWLLASGTTLLALFSHEAAVSIFALVPAMLWLTGRQGAIRVANLWPFLLPAVFFTIVFGMANWRNPTLERGDYTIGRHMFRKALDYLVSFYVGPHALSGYLTVSIGYVVALMSGLQFARLGVVWTLLTIIPFLGFTSGNVSRYLYLPTMGFSWIVAALLVALYGRLARRYRKPAAAIVVGIFSAFIVGRFAAFTSKAIQDRLDWLDGYKTYLVAFEQSNPNARNESRLRAVLPKDADVRAEFIQPMLRWIFHRPDLIVDVEPAVVPAGRSE